MKNTWPEEMEERVKGLFLRNKKKGTIDEHTCNITEKMMEDWLFLRFFCFCSIK